MERNLEMGSNIPIGLIASWLLDLVKVIIIYGMEL